MQKGGVASVVGAQVARVVFKLASERLARHHDPVDDVAKRQNGQHVFAGQVAFLQVAPDAALVGDGDRHVLPLPDQHGVRDDVGYQALAPRVEPQVDLGDGDRPKGPL